MSSDHKPPAAPVLKVPWVPTDELFFQILGVAVAILLLKNVF